MNKICFVYTETTGLHQTYENVNKKNLYAFARLVTLNYEIGYVENKEYIQDKIINYIVKPNCMIIPEDTIKYHGITLEYAEEKGIDINKIFDKFKNDIKKVNIIVGHNLDFHLKTILAEAVRYNIPLDFNNILLVDTVSFFHDYGYIKLKDLAAKLNIKDIPNDNKNNTELIRDVFLKLYSKYQKTIKTS